MLKLLLFLLASAVCGLLLGWLTKVVYGIPAKTIFVYAAIIIAAGSFFCWRFGLTKACLWGMSLAAIGSFFSTEDILRRQVSDWLHVLLFVLGCFRLSADTWKQMAIGAFVCSVPMLIMALVKSGGIGGADIKCVAALGWCLGWERCFVMVIAASVLSLLAACAVGLIRHTKIRSVPMVPFYCASAVLAYGLL